MTQGWPSPLLISARRDSFRLRWGLKLQLRSCVSFSREEPIVPPDCLLAPDQVGLPAPTTPSRLNMLTGRELSVVQAIQQGKSNKIIAHELNMGLSTVKVHLRNVMRKMNAKNRTDVAMKLNLAHSAF